MLETYFRSQNKMEQSLRYARRIFLLKNPLIQALKAIECSFGFTANYWILIGDIVDVLKPVKEALLGITRDDANIVTAKYSFEYIFTSLAASDTKLLKELSEAIKIEYGKISPKYLVDMLDYFKNHKFAENLNGEENFNRRKSLQSLATSLYFKLFAYQKDLFISPIKNKEGVSENNAKSNCNLSNYDIFINSKKSGVSNEP